MSDVVKNIYIEKGIIIRIVDEKLQANIIIERDMTTYKSRTNNTFDQLYLLLVDKGVSTRAGGFKYYKEALKILRDKTSFTMDKDVYPVIVNTFNTADKPVTEMGVSRAMQNCLRRSKFKGIGPKSFITMCLNDLNDLG